MKKSEKYQKAMMAVMRDNGIPNEQKLEIIEQLLADKSLAEWNEAQKENEA